MRCRKFVSCFFKLEDLGGSWAHQLLFYYHTVNSLMITVVCLHSMSFQMINTSTILFIYFIYIFNLKGVFGLDIE